MRAPEVFARELVFTPTSASFLNRIECHFWAIGEFVVNNADYPDWDTLRTAIADRIHYRNGPPRRATAQGRAPPDRRLNDEVSGATFLGDPLARSSTLSTPSQAASARSRLRARFNCRSTVRVLSPVCNPISA